MQQTENLNLTNRSHLLSTFCTNRPPKKSNGPPLTSIAHLLQIKAPLRNEIIHNRSSVTLHTHTHVYHLFLGCSLPAVAAGAPCELLANTKLKRVNETSIYNYTNKCIFSLSARHTITGGAVALDLSIPYIISLQSVYEREHACTGCHTETNLSICLYIKLQNIFKRNHGNNI